MTLVAKFASDEIVGLSDNDPVASWPDTSGSGFAAGNGTASARPLYKTNIQASKPGVLFDGVDDSLSYHPVNTDLISRFSVFRWSGASSGDGGFPRIWDSYGYSLYINDTTKQLQFRVWRGTTAGDFRTPNNSIVAGTTYLVEVYYDRTLTTNLPVIFLNGIQQTIQTVTPPSGVAISDTFLVLGSGQTSTRAFKGYHFEHTFYNTVLDAVSATNERSRLLSKWGLGSAPKAEALLGNEASTGNIPIMVLTKDTVRGSIAVVGQVTPVRRASVPREQIAHTLGMSGTITRRFVRKKLRGTLNFNSALEAAQPAIATYSTSHAMGLSGTVSAVKVRIIRKGCKECLKRWAHRMFSRCD